MALRKYALSLSDDTANIVDTATGEVKDQVHADRDGKLIHVYDRPKFKEPFVMVFQTFLEELARSDIQGRDLKVLLFMVANMDYENKVCISQKRIAEELLMNAQHVSRAIKNLIARGMVGRSDNVYYVTPYLTWRGRVRNFPKAVEGYVKEPARSPRKHAV